MSEISKDSLEEILPQLECHFNWTLMKDDIDPDELEERIAEQIEFLLSKSKVQNYNLLAYVKFLNGKTEEALENLKKAEEAVKMEYPKEIEKESLVTWSNYAWVYYHKDKLPESQNYIKKVGTTCEKCGSAFPYKVESPQIYCEKGWALLKFGGNYYEKAKEGFAKALEADPENPEFNRGYAITLYRLENFYEKKSAAKGSSLELLRRAMQLNPDDPFVMCLLGLKLQETDEVEEGEKYMEEALEKHPDLPYVLRYAAKFYRKKRNVERSLVLLKKALDQSPNSSFLHHQMGLCYRAEYFKINSEGTQRDLGQMAELARLSIFHFKKAVEKKTKFFYAYVDLANMYAQRKELQKADSTFQKAFSTKKLTLEEIQQLHFNYGRFQEYHKKSESEAMKHYLAGLKIENDSIERNKCQLQLRKLIGKKIQKGSAEAQSFGILGFIHQLSGEKEQAIECYEKALSMDPDNEDYLSSLMNLRLSLES